MEIRASEKGAGIVIEIRDQGPGIPTKHMPGLCERFYRAGKARSRRMGGTGLGLFIVKHIVQVHGGWVAVKSEIGKRSVFSTHLPQFKENCLRYVSILSSYDHSGAVRILRLVPRTIMVSVIAMLVAVPLGLMSTIYLSEYAVPKFRVAAKPLLEILAGIPTEEYGFFAALTVAPFFRQICKANGVTEIVDVIRCIYENEKQDGEK